VYRGRESDGNREVGKGHGLEGSVCFRGVVVGGKRKKIFGSGLKRRELARPRGGGRLRRLGGEMRPG